MIHGRYGLYREDDKMRVFLTAVEQDGDIDDPMSAHLAVKQYGKRVVQDAWEHGFIRSWSDDSPEWIDITGGGRRWLASGKELP